MASNVVHDLVVVPYQSDRSGKSPAGASTRDPSRTAEPSAFFGGIAARNAEYELRLLDGCGRQIKMFKFNRAGDESARQLILSVRDDFERYELWRGMNLLGLGWAPDYPVIPRRLGSYRCRDVARERPSLKLRQTLAQKSLHWP